MQPTIPTFSDLYTHQRHHQISQFNPHFPPQNPNPYPLHQHHDSHIGSQLTGAAIDSNLPGSDPYFQSYSICHPVEAYSYAIGSAMPSTYAADLVAHNWVPEESAQQYGDSLYAVGGTIPQDVSQHLLLPVNPTQTTWTNQIPSTKPRVPWKKIPKKKKIAQSVWCEICKIECNRKDILNKHKLGKKHIKNVEKLNPAASVATSKPIIRPVENSKKGNLGIKNKAETAQDLEMKRRKVVAGGADANAVRICGICNVVCNSDAVFRFHLAGQKHASMWKKLQEAGTLL